MGNYEAKYILRTYIELLNDIYNMYTLTYYLYVINSTFVAIFPSARVIFIYLFQELVWVVTVISFRLVCHRKFSVVFV